MTFSHWTISTRLRLGFGILIAMTVAMAVLGINAMQDLNRTSDEMANKVWVRARLANLVADNLRGSMTRLAQMVAATDPDVREMAGKKVGVTTSNFNKALKELGPLVLTPQGKALLADTLAQRDKYLADCLRVVALANAGKNDEAVAFAYGATYNSNLEFAYAIRRQIAFEEKSFEVMAAAAGSTFVNARKLMWSAVIGAVVLGLGAALLTTRSIVHPLKRAVAVARTVAAGDLTADIPVHSRDETGQLMQALKDMNAALLKIVTQVHSGSEEIAIASREIAGGNLDLSARTEQQASSLEKTTSSMEEMTSTVRQNAENAQQANALAVAASDVAREAGAAVTRVVETMNDIDSTSRQIVDIISVIDGIAFQTNILALNAAVEAARASEQGRGFAVVAGEVRNLAQRSAAAAREINALLGASVEKVNVGSKLVNEAGTTMNKVVGSVQRVTDLMTEISCASREQAAGITEINQSIAKLDTMTQQNAALVEEAAGAAGSLQDQAAQLARLISTFKVDCDPREVAASLPVATCS
jgi:methyl-accepting chemotaxis protein